MHPAEHPAGQPARKHGDDGVPMPLDQLLQQTRKRGRSFGWNRNPGSGPTRTPTRTRHREGIPRWPLFLVLGIAALTVAAWFGARYWIQSAMRDSLPQIDGRLGLPYLDAPVTVLRDAHGVPHIRASSVDDLVMAQGYITAQDRLWQMETLRRHAAGSLAEVLGAKLVAHDRTQRILQIRAAADRAIAALDPAQRHFLDMYARGVNASIDAQRSHLPVEFRLLRFTPAPWTPRDSILVGLAMFEDLTNSFPGKLGRETIAAKLPPELLVDLYPVGSWRDHPPGQPPVDLTMPGADVEAVPLDESQTRLRQPSEVATPEHIDALLALKPTLAQLSSRAACDSCTAGSNNWAVAGSHTASGKPLLSNDMHLSPSVPGIWYEADLKAGSFHTAGVTLPGTPFVIVGHNDHVAWGFTNLGADVQDLTVERIRGNNVTQQFQNQFGEWQPLGHQREVIRVKGAKDIVLDVLTTQHGTLPSPIISGLYPGEKRLISLTWTIYDPANVTSPFFTINSAADATTLTTAFASFGGPAQNMVCADDKGHIGYHAVGRIPVRGDTAHPTPPLPTPAVANIAANSWITYIPYDLLPSAVDPPGGVFATANARVTPLDYPYPITLDWEAPYRNERIWKVLSQKTGLEPKDMLALETDVYSDLDHVIAQRLAYAIDHATLPAKHEKRLHQAADLLRHWDGRVDAASAPAAVLDAARAALWPLLLTPKLGTAASLYTWGAKPFAEEQLIMHTPSRWLPTNFKTWDDLLVTAVDQGLEAGKAPADLATWRYGAAHPVEIENPVLSASPLLKRLVGIPIGVEAQTVGGDDATVKQIRRSLGPSERFTADLANLDRSTLNLVLGQSGNPTSPWFLDQWPSWLGGKTFPLPYSDPAVTAATAHTLTLAP